MNKTIMTWLLILCMAMQGPTAVFAQEDGAEIREAVESEDEEPEVVGDACEVVEFEDDEPEVAEETMEAVESEDDEPMDAASNTGYEIVYRIVDGEAHVTDYRKYDVIVDVVNIDAEYNGCPVTTIDENAFGDDSSGERSKTNGTYQVVIPSSVKNIAARAFYHKTGQISSSDPDLQAIVIEGTPGIGESAFEGSAGLRRITGSAASIGAKAFKGCSSLYECQLSPKDKTIRSETFSGTALQTYTFSKKYTIESKAFDNCTKLKTLNFTTAQGTVADDAFYGCSIDVLNVNAIDTWRGMARGKTKSFFVNLMKDSVFQIDGSKLTTYVDDSSESIPYLFYGCSSLKKVVFKTEKTVGTQTFANCKYLESIRLEAAVSIEADAFKNTDRLTIMDTKDIRFYFNSSYSNSGANPLTSNAYLYLNGQYVSDLVIPEGLEYLIDGKLSAIRNTLATVTIPGSVDQISDVFPNADTVLFNVYHNTEGFDYCVANGYHYVVLDNDTYNIHSGKYDIASWTVNVRTGVLTVNANGRIETYEYGDDLPWKEYSWGIRTIKMSNGITELGDSLFSNMQNVKEIIWSTKLESIGIACFSGMDGLQSVRIPSTVTIIRDRAFSGCCNLKSVKLLSSDANVSQSMFMDCYNLETVTLAKGVNRIGEKAFASCYALKTISIPDSVTRIEAMAFSDCHSLKSIDLPADIMYMGSRVFARRYSESDPMALSKIYFKGDCPKMQSDTFKDIKATAYHRVDAAAGEGLWTKTKLKNYGGTITWKGWLTAPVVKASTMDSTGGVKLTWAKIGGAAKYTIYRASSKSGTYKTVGTTTKLSYQDNEALTIGKVYYYKVKPVATDSSSTVQTSKIVSCRILPGVSSSISVSYTMTGLKVKWSRVRGASGYYIYRSFGGGKYTKVKTITSKTVLTWKDTSKKNAGNGYYYKVKAYTKYKGKIYTGAFSAADYI